MIRAFPLGQPRLHGFTVIELICAIGVIAVLAALMISGMAYVQEDYRSMRCLAHQKQIAMALLTYAQDNTGTLPSGAAQSPQKYSWNIEILPYLVDVPASSTLDNRLALRARQTVLTCPEFVRQQRPDELHLNWGFFGQGLNRSMGTPDKIDVSTNPLARNAQYTRLRLLAFQSPSRVILVGDTQEAVTESHNYQMMDASTKGSKTHRGSANYVFADGHAMSLTPENAALILNPN